ncbi:MAG: GldG family protein [Bacteroidota bacterium]|nr:GldG family protein [Bacteroidota bacterium]
MKAKFAVTVILTTAIIIVLNLLASEYHLRLDLTEDRQYTLSDATHDILEDLEEPVTIKAYFSENLPPNILKTRQDFQDLLIEYANIADGQLIYEFVDPGEKESAEQEASEKGIHPVLINVREKDQMKQQKAFLGATVQLGDKTEVIPFIQPGAAMEYALSTAIKKISIENKPVVGFVQGHGEPPLAEMQQANEQLSVLYQTQAVALTDSTTIPDDIKTLALIRPTDSIPASHFQQLDGFLERGGRLLLAINAVEGDFRSLYGTEGHTGVRGWLRKKGVEVVPNFVVDAQCGSVSVPQQFGGFTLQASVSFPYVPIITTFANHPVTSGLEGVMLEFASEVKPANDSIRGFVPLAFSSELSNTLPAPQFMSIDKEWTESDLPRKNVPVAAALDTDSLKLVVIADGDFPVNGPAYPQQQPRSLQPDNVNLLANALDWLSDDTGLIDLRTKGAAFRPIRELDDSTKTLLKYANFILPILLVIGYGVIRAQRNRLTRIKRMNENYEAV